LCRRRRRADADSCSNRGSNPAGWRRGSRNKATLAAASLLDGEALGLTRQAVEAALAGDMSAMKLCLERVLPRCHERPVTFSLPSLAAIGDGEIDEPSPQNVSRAGGIAKDKVGQGNLLQILEAGDDVEDEDENIGDAEAIDDCDP
jgi:hypothetical protein